MIARLAQQLLNFLLYANVWIAVCATSMVLLTEWRLNGTLVLNPLNGFVFFSTWSLYCGHRLVGMERVKRFRNEGRYRVIYRYRRHIVAYAVIGALGAIFCFWQLPRPVQLWTIAPALVSLGYVLPFLRGKRLRDFDFWKIFLVAGAFAWVTVALPWFHHRPGSPPDVWLLLERFCFIFAITIPFDIRDLRVDAHTRVRTIPALLGVWRSKGLAIALLIASVVFLFLGGWEISLGFVLTFPLVAMLIWQASREREDAYYTGFLDGTMVVQLVGTLVSW